MNFDHLSDLRLRIRFLRVTISLWKGETGVYPVEKLITGTQTRGLYRLPTLYGDLLRHLVSKLKPGLGRGVDTRFSIGT